jgi:hypothetical protein
MSRVINHCIGCDCTEISPCWGRDAAGQVEPCHWIALHDEDGVGVCSECPGELPRFVREHVASYAGQADYVGPLLLQRGYHCALRGGESGLTAIAGIIARHREQWAHCWLIPGEDAGRFELWVLERRSPTPPEAAAAAAAVEEQVADAAP